ncbi:SPFH domain-containing protein [Mucilaginibacter galii]|uniref:Membrane protease family stomatin/prohibitin-like protein n=1 Tax=Mucilaginibacter galii TaxID=2005073 RepID=A0A917N2L8_9SPHI|nr:SPFH domain-containing protein [Mucilaginibacter galii]GGI51664.1 membrane protease family stomatin/prohibitin-like protein [Mucilaginibacter galii]
MGFTDFFKEQFAAVIEWKNQPQELLFYKYPFKSDEIKDASKLIVAPGQGCILVYQGKVTGVLQQEGTYTLQTDNDPFITTLFKLMQGFESEHKLKIYFYRKAAVVNQGWGTSTRVKYEEPVYKFPVSLGAYGNYSFIITDATLFLTQIAGMADAYTTAQAQMLIQSRIEQQLTVTLATTAFGVLQIDSKLNQLADELKAQLNGTFAELGFQLANLQVQGASFDQQTQQQINQIANARAGKLAAEQAGLNYTEMEKLQALRDAASNESGTAGAGLQINLGNSLGNSFEQTSPKTGDEPFDAVTQLQKLKTLLDQGIITLEEFEAKKKQWLDKL